MNLVYRFQSEDEPALRALYRRRKGRDLFDLAYALEHGGVDVDKVIAAFARYLRESGRSVARADFERNLAAKMEDELFLADMTPLLWPGVGWDPQHAAQVVSAQLVARLRGPS